MFRTLRKSHFFAALFDSYCGLANCVKMRRAFTEYVELIETFRKKNLLKFWAEHDLQFLMEMMSYFKDRACEIFGKYQSADMSTQKWQAVAHLPDSRARTGGVSYFHAGLYKPAHKD